jgi:hypothetical protein
MLTARRTIEAGSNKMSGNTKNVEAHFISHQLTDAVHEIGALILSKLDADAREHALEVARTVVALARNKDIFQMEQAQLIIASMGQFASQNGEGVDIEASADYTYDLVRDSKNFGWTQCEEIRGIIRLAGGLQVLEPLSQNSPVPKLGQYLTEANASLTIPISSQAA